MSVTVQTETAEGFSSEAAPGVRTATGRRPWDRLGRRAFVARTVGFTLLAAAALIGPHGLKWAGPSFALGYGLCFAMVVLAVTVLGWVGEISLAIVAQMGFGLIFAAWFQQHGVPLGLNLALVVVASIPLSLLIGIFALRLSGVSFVIASLAFGYLAQKVVFDDWMGTTEDIKGKIVRPSYIFQDDQLYYLILAGLIVSMVACYMIKRSRIGMGLTAMRDSETAFWTLGHSPAAYKLFVVCLSGAIATLAGAFYALLQLRIPALYFHPGLAIMFFGFALAGGLGSIGGAVGAGVLLGALPKYLETLTKSRAIKYDFLVYGLITLILITRVNGGLAGLCRRLWARIEGRRA